MDTITKELDDLITQYDFEGRHTDVACCNKIKMDYYLMLTIAVMWDIKHLSMSRENIDTIVSCLQKPSTGKLIKLLGSGLGLHKEILRIFNSYREDRNFRFGHTTFDEYEANNLNHECKQCYKCLMELNVMEDNYGEVVRKLYQEENNFFYIASTKQNGDVLIKQFGYKNESIIIPKLELKSRMINNKNDIRAGDLFIMVDDTLIKVSPFIMYSGKQQLFLMLMDIETSPLAFKMAYIYRREYASDSAKYLDEFPMELADYFPKEDRKLGQNGVVLNKFYQFELYEQNYCHSIHQSIQRQLDEFIVGNMAYGAVRGVGGVGKTSAVFMWMRRVIGNKNGILDTIRERFALKRIIFLSAKTKIYSRSVNAENLSNFYDIESDVSSFEDIVNHVYSAFHPHVKEEITFEEKVDYIKSYSNQTHAILIVIDDYESLPPKSREKVQKLKDDLTPNCIKILITTRFASKEAKDIIVEQLNEHDCSEMTDYIFADLKWKSKITPAEMHKLTNGLPLLIWYAKAYYQIGQLTSKKLNFSGPAKGLGEYLYDNFVLCFEDKFIKNFLMIATRYYEIHNVLQISKKTAIFLCIEDPKMYKLEDEEFYFQELSDLKLITINQSTNAVDFSPLKTYMDKVTKKQEPQNQYQKDSLKVLAHLDEEKYKDISAVVASIEYLENETKSRILYRIVEFSRYNEDIKMLALDKLFEISSDKINIYKYNIFAFQSNPKLIKSMIEYLLECKEQLLENYETVRDFIYSVSVTIDNEDIQDCISIKALTLTYNMMGVALDARERGEITNPELHKHAIFLRERADKINNRIHIQEEAKCLIENINIVIDDISTYCEIERLDVL